MCKGDIVRKLVANANTPPCRVVYVGGPDALWALDVESGRALWKFGTGKMVGSSPVVNTHLSRLYVGCEDGYLYGFALPPALRAPYVHPR